MNHTSMLMLQMHEQVVHADAVFLTWQDIVAQGNTEGVLPCLVEHKNDQGMDEKCHASIEHWQLVSWENHKKDLMLVFY